MRAASTSGAASHARPASAAAAPAHRPFDGLPTSVVEDSLARVVASGTFRRSERHQRFLRHVVRATLDGRQDELREIVIGVEVYDRDVARFDPRRDPIVRVEAGRVREKLARYYASEGTDDAFEIQLPVGGYLPRLAPRSRERSADRVLGSIAVLPIESLSAEPEDAIFCAGLADQLIDLLSRVRGLRVVGRLSSSKAKASGLDPKAIGKLLGVTSVLEGSVQRAGARYRCIVQLFRARDRACVWSQRFECDVQERAALFAFQDRVGDAVLAAVAPHAARTEAPPASAATRGDGRNAEARDLFERGRYLEQQRTIEGWQKAIALFTRAVALDPGFAPAHSHLGASLGQLATILAQPSVPAFREVARHARRALELDPSDGDARALLANIVFRIEFDWRRAEPMFLEALRAAPNSAMAHNAYGGGLVFNGRYVDGREHARIALDLDPLNIALRVNSAVISTYARDFAAAIDEFHAVLEFDADHHFALVMLGMALLWNGRIDEAMTHFEHATRTAPDHAAAWICRIFVHGARGECERGRRELAELLARIGDRPFQHYNLAMAHAYLGDRNAMYDALEKVVEIHEVLFISIPADPTFDPYRDDPRMVALMARHGLPRLPPSPFVAH